MAEVSFKVGDAHDFGAEIEIDEKEVTIHAEDFAGTWDNPSQSASHTFSGDRRIAFIRFCADVAKRFPLPDEDAG